MRIMPIRTVAVAAALAVVGGLGYTLVAGPASADTDPVTGGTTTISVPLSAEFGALSPIYALPTASASLSYDPSAKELDYSYPVVGGDASVNTFFGTLKLDGGLVIGKRGSRTTVTLTNLVFNIEDDTVTATVPALPGSTPAPVTVVFFDALGNHDLAVGPPETFTASELRLDPAGAKYLNTALHTKLFKKSHLVGTFAASFTNSND